MLPLARQRIFIARHHSTATQSATLIISVRSFVRHTLQYVT